MNHAHRHVLGLCTAGLVAIGSLSVASAQDTTVPAAGTTTQPATTTYDTTAPAQTAPTTASPTVTNDGSVVSTTQVTTTQAAPATATTTTTTTRRTLAQSAEPDTYRVDREGTYVYPNRYMLTGGATMLLIGYVPGAIVAATKDYDGDKYLYYPVAGPWMYLARRDHSRGEKALLVVDGIVQDLGALEFLLAFVVPEKKERRWYEFGKNDVRVLPRMSASTAGLWAAGRF